MQENISIEEIKKEWGKNKVVPKYIEEVFYRAISHYPELKDVYLFVVEEKFYGIQHTLRCYPPLLSLFSKKENRVIPIVINKHKNIAMSFNTLSKEHKIGILAHEMGHICEYLPLSSWELVLLGLRFAFSKKFIYNLEQNADKFAISRGCGEYLLEERERFAERASGLYVNYAHTVYMSPAEIVGEMKKYPDLYDLVKLQNMKVSYVPESYVGQKSFHKTSHALKTVYGFLIAWIEMVNLVYLKKIHKKPNWYSE